VRALGVILLLCLSSAVASADPITERVTAGEELAKQGKWSEAIENFKAADKIEKRAKHACLIALAYIRRELWPQAEVFLTLCHERATTGDPVPDWVQLAEQQLKERLAKAKVAAVQIRVAPSALSAQAQVAVSAFEPDELFAPRTIHLGLGKHLITVTAPGRDTRQQTIEITDDSPREVVIDFDAKAAPPIPTAPRSTVQGPSKLPLIVAGIGGAIMIGGGAYHMIAFKPARDDLAAASKDNDQARYDELEAAFDSKRRNTFVLYGVGAAVVATGVVLKYTVYKDKPEQAPRVGVGVAPGGGMLVMEWSR
jgi:hypothetical protein